MRTILLSFKNRTAGETHKITCSWGSIEAIMAWYGAFYAGDDYTVMAGSQIIPQDQNGEREAGQVNGSA